jgi:hypothetical protein
LAQALPRVVRLRARGFWHRIAIKA